MNLSEGFNPDEVKVLIIRLFLFQSITTHLEGRLQDLAAEAPQEGLRVLASHSEVLLQEPSR